MTEDEAWEKITKITNKESLTHSDIKRVRALMEFMSEDKQAWVEEGLFLADVVEASD